MNYFEEIDAWLSAVLFGGPEELEPEEIWFERVKKELRDKILQSYRNGQKAGLKPEKKVSGERPREVPKKRFWRGNARISA